MKAGDVVLVRFPHTDLSEGKLRPALVIAAVPGRHGDLLLALISSRTHQAIPEFDELIEDTAPDFSASGLKTRSLVRLARLAAISSSLLAARLGHISPERLANIKTRLASWLAE
jgi:mRNA interferase MazF